MAKVFSNIQTVKVEIGEFKGTFTIPIMLTDEDLDKYIRANIASREKMEAAEREGEPMIISGTQVQMDSRAHMVKSVDFPGVTIENFRNGSRPFPALSQHIIAAVEPLINDALTAPN